MRCVTCVGRGGPCPSGERVRLAKEEAKAIRGQFGEPGLRLLPPEAAAKEGGGYQNGGLQGEGGRCSTCS